MKKTNKCLLLLLLISPSVFAAGPFGGRDWSDRYNHPDHHKAGVGSVFGSGASRTTSTVTPTSTGTSIVTQGTQRVAGTDVPIGVKSDYARGAITTAAVAAAALCGSNPLTAIICGAAIQYGLEKGIKQCEASGWCQDSPTTEVYYTGQFVETPTIKASSSDSYCQQKFAGGGRTEIITSPNSFPTQGSCQFKLNGSTYNGGQWVKQTGTVTNPPPPTPSQPPWADPGFPPYLTGRQGSEPNFGPQIGGEATGAGHAPESSPAGGPTVTASPATGAPKTSTSTTPKSDGSTDTTTTTTTTTVTPTVTNNNTTNPTVTYNTSTNTTTSTTNNVTNITTVTNTTTQSPGETPELTLPDDYNREATQQEIKNLLDTAGAPVMPDQKPIVDAAKSKSDTDLTQLQNDAKTGQADKSAWFSWVWTPPVGSCQPFAGSVHGYSISWDVCPTINNIRDVLGWLFAIFGALEIYGQLFKRSE